MSPETWIEITDGDPEGYEAQQDEHETREEPCVCNGRGVFVCPWCDR